jgi:nitroreductase
MMLDLTPDELLSTTRSVRKRLDLARPVEISLVRECLELAVQAPTGSNMQSWHFVVVTDAAKKQALADLYRQAWEIYLTFPHNVAAAQEQDPAKRESARRISSSAYHLVKHLHEVPVLLIPCIAARVERAQTHAVFQQAGIYGSILPAAWSFMLAARSRGLVSCWTTFHLMFEQAAAELLGIPYASVTQTALIAVAYPIGESFRPAPRKPLDDILHLDTW